MALLLICTHSTHFNFKYNVTDTLFSDYILSVCQSLTASLQYIERTDTVVLLEARELGMEEALSEPEHRLTTIHFLLWIPNLLLSCEIFPFREPKKGLGFHLPRLQKTKYCHQDNLRCQQIQE